MTLILILLFFIILNLVLFYKYKLLAKINNIYDFPDNRRKIHKLPVPLIGGLIIYINILFFLIIKYFFNIEELSLFSNLSELIIFLLIITMFFFLGRVDDKNDLNSFKKFILMIIFLIGAINLDKQLLLTRLDFSFVEKNIHLGNFSYFFTILCFLLFINAFNMIDGINGQAATYTITIFFIYISQNIFIIFLIILVLNLIIFIFYNFKNLMFLGDSGSLILGFLISYISIKAYNQNFISNTDEIFLIMCIPGYELLRLFIKRISIRKNPFAADGNHIHHYLINKFSHIKTFFIMQALFFSPILSYFIFKNFYISLFLSLFFYMLLLILLSKNNNFAK